jgi:hypothetical protein
MNQKVRNQVSQKQFASLVNLLKNVPKQSNAQPAKKKRVPRPMSKSFRAPLVRMSFNATGTLTAGAPSTSGETGGLMFLCAKEGKALPYTSTSGTLTIADMVRANFIDYAQDTLINSSLKNYRVIGGEFSVENISANSDMAGQIAMCHVPDIEYNLTYTESTGLTSMSLSHFPNTFDEIDRMPGSYVGSTLGKHTIRMQPASKMIEEFRSTDKSLWQDDVVSSAADTTTTSSFQYAPGAFVFIIRGAKGNATENSFRTKITAHIEGYQHPDTYGAFDEKPIEVKWGFGASRKR